MKITTEQLKQRAEEAGSPRELLRRLTGRRFAEDGDEELGEAAARLLACRDKLESQARWVKEAAERVLTKLDRPLRLETQASAVQSHGIFADQVNGLGELQGTGPAFDVACALYDEAAHRFDGIVLGRAHEERKAEREQKLREEKT